MDAPRVDARGCRTVRTPLCTPLNDVNQMCAKTFLERIFMCAQRFLVCAHLTACVRARALAHTLEGTLIGT